MAKLLGGMASSTISRIERGNRSANSQTMEILRMRLTDPRIKAILEAAGCPHPWPGEKQSTDTVGRLLSRLAAKCRLCGRVLNEGSQSGKPGLCQWCVVELEDDRTGGRPNHA